MPTKRSRLTLREQDEYRSARLQLESLGVAIGTAEDLWPQPVRFSLEPGEPEFARIYDLPGGDVAVVLPTKLTILKSGVMFIEACILAEWSSIPLDLEGAEQNRYFDRFKRLGPTWEPKILNDLLVGRPHPLRRCQWTGFIVATGFASIPADCEDGDWLSLKLHLRDAEGDDFSFDFTAAVDQRFKLEYERSRQTRSATEAVPAKRSLFEATCEPAITGNFRGQNKDSNAENSGITDEISWSDVATFIQSHPPSAADNATNLEREGGNSVGGPPKGTINTQ